MKLWIAITKETEEINGFDVDVFSVEHNEREEDLCRVNFTIEEANEWVDKLKKDFTVIEIKNR